MTRKLLWLSLPILFGMLVAALAVAAPALAASALAAKLASYPPRLAALPLHRLGKGKPFGLHQPFKGIAAGATAEAMIGPPLVLHLEGGRFFLMEGAAAPHHPALADQLDPAAHQLDQIRPPQNFFQKALAVAHG